MRLLLDSHIVIAMGLGRLHATRPVLARRLASAFDRLWVSTATLWEIAIKTRLGKLDPGVELADLPSFLKAGGITILPITAAHALAQADPAPPTRDPFDRMLLAQCAVEGLRLVTFDRALVGHPLAARLDETPTPRNPRTRR